MRVGMAETSKMSARTAGMHPRLVLPKASLATITPTLMTQALEALRVPTRSVSRFSETGSAPALLLETRTIRGSTRAHTLQLSARAGISILSVRSVLDKFRLVANLCRVSTNFQEELQLAARQMKALVATRETREPVEVLCIFSRFIIDCQTRWGVGAGNGTPVPAGRRGGTGGPVFVLPVQGGAIS